MTWYKRYLRETIFFFISVGITAVGLFLLFSRADISVYIYMSLLLLCILFLVYRICFTQSQIPTYIARDIVVQNVISPPPQVPISTIIVIQQPEHQYAIGYLDRKTSRGYSV